MSRCIYCGKELATGDSCWISGTCNECYAKYIKSETMVGKPVCIATSPRVIIPCLICGEEAKRLYKIMSEIQTIYICDKCKKAVMKMREKQMEIKTKFDIGQTVYTINSYLRNELDFNNDRLYTVIEKRYIYDISFKIETNGTKIITYHLMQDNKYEYKEEYELFATKEEAEQKLKEIENAEKR